MTVDLKSPRPDIVFIKRRLKVGETAPQKVQTVTQGLSLSRPATGETLVQAPVKAKPLISVPTLENNTVLNKKNPVVRLSAKQSSIGTLVISNSALFAWEAADYTTGFNYSNPAYMTDYVSIKTGQTYPPLPEVKTPTYGNRALAEYEGQDIYVTLRHFRKLRRLIVVSDQNKPIIVKTASGKTVTVEYGVNTVLYVSVINNVVELRLEKFKGNLHETFRIGTYTPASH